MVTEIVESLASAVPSWVWLVGLVVLFCRFTFGPFFAQREVATCSKGWDGHGYSKPDSSYEYCPLCGEALTPETQPGFVFRVADRARQSAAAAVKGVRERAD